MASSSRGCERKRLRPSDELTALITKSKSILLNQPDFFCLVPSVLRSLRAKITYIRPRSHCPSPPRVRGEPLMWEFLGGIWDS